MSAENIWENRDLGLKPEVEAFRPITKKDVKYLCDNIYPFVQVLKGDDPSQFFTVEFVKASTGWIIHDYGDALSVSAPYFSKKDEDEDEGGGKGGGTIIGQQAQTAEEIINLIKEKGWASVELIAGNAVMQRCVWLAADEKKIPVKGYSPSDQDARIAKERKRKIALAHDVKQKPELKND